jgi:Ca2+-binding RTX toxin-like protein
VADTIFTDQSTTNTGLDRLTDMVMSDSGLSRNIPDSEIVEGADFSNAMADIINEAIVNTRVGEDNKLDADDVRLINAYILKNHADTWAWLHGDDEKGEETGFHLVQNDDATTRMFGKNFVNTVLDGINHLGFEIQGNTLLNEDGDPNAKISDVADWLNYFYVDQSTTDTRLDYLVDAIKSDEGLSRNTSAKDINGGAHAANEMNKIIIEAIEKTGVAKDQVINVEDVRAINGYIRDNYLEKWVELHGDDEACEETGFHLVQNDGGNIKYRGDQLINTVADGLYHLGFAIEGDNILNEDGNRNASLGDLATWLNNFYLDAENTFGSQNDDRIKGLNTDDAIWAREGNDKVYADDGDDTVFGESGDDRLYGQDGEDDLHGGDGDDKLSGGDGHDRLQGGSGNDRLSGGDGEDLMLGGTGNDRLHGGDGGDQLYGEAGSDSISGGDDADVIYGGADNDYLSGNDGDDIIDGKDGNDRLSGGDGADVLIGGLGEDRLSGHSGDDALDGGAGNDRLSGGDGNDKLEAGDGHDKLSGGSGDDLLNAGAGDDYLSGGSGKDTLIGDTGDDRLSGGDGDDSLDAGEGNDRLSGGSGNDMLLGGAGDDQLYGSSGNDHLIDGAGADRLYGGDGDDRLTVVGDGANDVLIGGDGKDTFEFLVSNDETIGQDVIKGFDIGDDRLVFGGDVTGFEFDYVRSNHGVVTLKSGDATLGTVDVWGDLGESDETPLIEIEGSGPAQPGLLV